MALSDTLNSIAYDVAQLEAERDELQDEVVDLKRQIEVLKRDNEDLEAEIARLT